MSSLKYLDFCSSENGSLPDNSTMSFDEVLETFYAMEKLWFVSTTSLDVKKNLYGRRMVPTVKFCALQLLWKLISHLLCAERPGVACNPLLG